MRNSGSALVAIIDYGMGNLFSVKQAAEKAGLNANITSKGEDVSSADAVILPGVGAFGDAMAALHKLGLVDPILSFIKNGKPFMGICLGMQLLMSESREFGMHKGLDIIQGSVVIFPVQGDDGKKNKVPHVGWNQIKKPAAENGALWDKSPLADVRCDEYMYFVHSYYCKPDDSAIILSITEYAGIEYCSSILWKNVFATQFHPEKSGWEGGKIYRDWAATIKI